jgi:hypothetical protein
MLKPFEEILPALRSEMSLLEELRVRLRKQAMNGWMFIGATLLIGGGVAAACFAQGGTVPGIILAVATLVGMRFIGYFQISKPSPSAGASWRSARGPNLGTFVAFPAG